MRRNTVTIVKYLIFAAFFLTLGPIMIKLLFGDSHDQSLNVKHARGNGGGPQFMPVDPDDMKKIFVPVSVLFSYSFYFEY